MQEIVTGNFAPFRWVAWPPTSVRIVDWNIDRGLQLQGVIDFLAGANADILILQEVDLNARRTRRLNIAEEIARNLRMNYVFGREFQELVQGSEGSPAYHGQATLARWPISNPRLIRFARQSQLLAATLVSAEDGTLSRETRWKNCVGGRHQHLGKQICDLQPSSGESR